MNPNAYEKLRSRLNTFPTGMPKTKEGYEIALLKKFFTEQEAEIASHLPMMAEGTLKNPRTLAEEMQTDAHELETAMESMTKNGLLFLVEENGENSYALLPFIPGILEFNVDKIDAEIAQLYEDYYESYTRGRLQAQIPLTRIVPINRSISSETKVYPYEDVIEAIKESTSLCVMDCMCRTQKKMIGKDCGRPIETCLYMNVHADHLLNIGKGRKVSIEEAIDVVTRAEDAGLMHISGNTQGLLGICSCCGCCCVGLQAITKMKVPTAVVKSEFRLAIDPESCSGCEECVDRCWNNALSMENEQVAVDRDRCFGCGSCVNICPTEALRLERKSPEETKPIPEDFDQLLSTMGWREETV